MIEIEKDYIPATKSAEQLLLLMSIKKSTKEMKTKRLSQTRKRLYQHLRREGLARAGEIAVTLDIPEEDIRNILSQSVEVGRHYSMQEAGRIIGISYPSVRRLCHLLKLGHQEGHGTSRTVTDADLEKIFEHRDTHTDGNPGFDNPRGRAEVGLTV